jgi:hypothetical protein
MGSHILCAVAAILVFLTLVQCTIKKPEAPTWDTQLVIPLANRTYDMQELIDKIDQDNLSTDSLGNPFFFYQRVLDTVTVEGSFAIADISENFAESLGVVQLDPFAGANATINLSDYIWLVLGDIPPISFDITEPLPPMGEFAMATVESGFAQISVQNDFGLDLDTVIVTINDINLGGQVTSYSIPGGILAGNIRVDTIDLAGKTISNQLELLLHCHTPGATSFSLANKSLSASVSMPAGPRVSSATAKIPEITKQLNESFEFNSDHQLQIATLTSGDLVLNIQNSSNVPAGLVITLPDIKNGLNPLVINQQVNPNSSQQVVYNLTGYSLEPTDQILPQSLPLDIEVNIDSSGPQMVTISAGDQFSVTTSIQNVSLGTIQGIIAPTTANFDNIEQEISLPKGFDQVQLTSAVLRLDIENSVNIPGAFSVDLDGDLGQHKSLNGAILPGTPQSPVTTVILDSNITSFMNPVPELLTVNGNATFGDGITSGSINADDYITATITISSPLDLIIDEATFDGDWQSTEIDQDAITKITDNLNLARVFMTVVNHLPLGVEAEVYLSGDSATLYSNPGAVLGPITVLPGALNPDGTVDTAIVSQTVLSLTNEQARILENDPLWIGQLITLESTNGETVRLTGDDYLSVSGYIEVNLTVSESLWED